jgi:hypothetical protein
VRALDRYAARHAADPRAPGSNHGTAFGTLVRSDWRRPDNLRNSYASFGVRSWLAASMPPSPADAAGRIGGISCAKRSGETMRASASGFPDSDARVNWNPTADPVPVWQPAAGTPPQDGQEPGADTTNSRRTIYLKGLWRTFRGGSSQLASFFRNDAMVAVAPGAYGTRNGQLRNRLA